MREIVWATAFKRDVKRIERQGKSLSALVEIFRLLAGDATLPARYRDHALKGSWSGHRELHIASDWLLIYRIAEETVFLVRTGSHAELFQL